MVKTLHSHCRELPVRSLVGELRSHMPHIAALKKVERKKERKHCLKQKVRDKEIQSRLVFGQTTVRQ